MLNKVTKFQSCFATTGALSKANRHPRELQLTSKKGAQVLSEISAHMRTNTDHGECGPFWPTLSFILFFPPSPILTGGGMTLFRNDRGTEILVKIILF